MSEEKDWMGFHKDRITLLEEKISELEKKLDSCVSLLSARQNTNIVEINDLQNMISELKEWKKHDHVYLINDHAFLVVCYYKEKSIFPCSDRLRVYSTINHINPNNFLAYN